MLFFVAQQLHLSLLMPLSAPCRSRPRDHAIESRLRPMRLIIKASQYVLTPCDSGSRVSGAAGRVAVPRGAPRCVTVLRSRRATDRIDEVLVLLIVHVRLRVVIVNDPHVEPDGRHGHGPQKRMPPPRPSRTRENTRLKRRARSR